MSQTYSQHFTPVHFRLNFRAETLPRNGQCISLPGWTSLEHNWIWRCLKHVSKTFYIYLALVNLTWMSLGFLLPWTLIQYVYPSICEDGYSGNVVQCSIIRVVSGLVEACVKKVGSFGICCIIILGCRFKHVTAILHPLLYPGQVPPPFLLRLERLLILEALAQLSPPINYLHFVAPEDQWDI
jgi:hypothetical protein